MKLKESTVYSNCSCYFILLYKQNKWDIHKGSIDFSRKYVCIVYFIKCVNINFTRF